MMLKDAAQWIVRELWVSYRVILVLVRTIVFWLMCRVPSMRLRLLADYGRHAQMQAFTGNWQVTLAHCDMSN